MKKESVDELRNQQIRPCVQECSECGRTNCCRCRHANHHRYWCKTTGIECMHALSMSTTGRIWKFAFPVASKAHAAWFANRHIIC